MAEQVLPRYPIYVPTKDRAEPSQALTIRFLLKDRVPFRIVVEPSQEERYRTQWPNVDMLVLPEDGMRLLGSRNWIRDHAEAEGHARHWQLDDNATMVYRWINGRQIACNSGVAFRVIEDFCDRYQNVGIAGMQYEMFVTSRTSTPFMLNQHVYSCSLINHAMPYRWRLVYNDDTDICLQALASGEWCTILFNAFVFKKTATMVIKGGNTDDLYQGDGRLKMARALERVWPYTVTVDRRYRRPQHVVRGTWRGFDTKLIRRTDIDWDNLPAVDNYGMHTVQVAEEIRSPAIQALHEEHKRSDPPQRKPGSRRPRSRSRGSQRATGPDTVTSGGNDAAN